MNSDFQWNLQQVADGIPRGVLEERAKRSFLYPHDNIWPKDGSQFTAIADTIYDNLPTDKKNLFLAVCLASFLLNPKKASDCQIWFQSKSSVSAILGLDLSWDEVSTSWVWGRVAIPGADHTEGWNDRILYALVGMSKKSGIALQLPSKIGSCLSQNARDSIQIAAELVVNRNPGTGLLFWPQLDYTNPNIAINGASLGLPVYLSFCSLAANKPIPSILATGSVDSDGILHEVTGLEEKFRLAHKKGFSSFLYPLLPGVKPLDFSGKVNPIGVQDLEQAYSLWISQKNVKTNDVGSLWITTALEKIGDQLSEIKRTLSQSRILVTLVTIIFIGLLMVFFYSSKQSSTTSRTETPADQPKNEIMAHPDVPELSTQTLPPEKSTLSSMRETPKTQINVTAQKAIEHPINLPMGNQQDVIANRHEDLNTAINNRILSENDDSATTASCFRVAKEMMSSSKLISAKKKYEECFTHNATYLDTILDYQKVLKALEGHQQARNSYNKLIQADNNMTVVFAELLFDEPKVRHPKIKKFLEIHPGYSPAYFWLGMDCYEVTESDEICKSYLQYFIESSKFVSIYQLFVNSHRLKVMIEEAKNKVYINQ